MLFQGTPSLCHFQYCTRPPKRVSETYCWNEDSLFKHVSHEPACCIWRIAQNSLRDEQLVKTHFPSERWGTARSTRPTAAFPLNQMFAFLSASSLIPCSTLPPSLFLRKPFSRDLDLSLLASLCLCWFFCSYTGDLPGRQWWALPHPGKLGARPAGLHSSHLPAELLICG